MKRWAFTVLYVAVAFSVGCGGGTSSTTETAKQPAPAPIPCTAAPGAASELRIVSINAGSVTLSWTAGTGAPASYVLEAGTAPGKSDASRIDLHSSDTAYTATSVKPGKYYARVVSVNACGSAPASNEVIAVVP